MERVKFTKVSFITCMERRILRGRPPAGGGKPTRSRLELRISKGLDALVNGVPEQSFSIREKDILRRIQEIHSGALTGGRRLTQADLLNLRNIAARFKIKV